MPFVPKTWLNQDLSTPWDAAGAIDMETRLAAYATTSRVYDVEKPPYNAVPDDFFLDGVATASSTTFTSATANFQPSDTGAYMVVLKAGASGGQDHHGTITYVNSTTVTMQSAAGRSQSSCRFYLSRNGNQGAAIQSAIDDAHDAGGGAAFLPGVGYYTGQTLILKNRVTLRGAGVKSTLLHLGPAVNAPVVKNDQTLNNAAGLTTIEDIWIDGNRGRQTNPTTTLTAQYNPGAGSITVASAAAFTEPVGTILIGSNYLEYTGVSGTTLTIGGGGLYGSTDAIGSNGATVTYLKCHGVMLAANPTSAGGTLEENYDPHHRMERVFVKNVLAYGVACWGMSSSVFDDVWSEYAEYCSFRSSWDSFWSNCVSGVCGRIGFYLRGSSTQLVNCKAWFCGGSSPTEGWGFLVEGPAVAEEGCRILSACNAQDNKADGFYLRLAQRVVLSGTASSNGVSSPGTYVGCRIDSCTNGSIDLACTERVASPNNSQRNALHFANTFQNSTAMKVRVTHAAATGSAVLTPLTAGSVISGSVDLSINGMGGTKAVSQAGASTLTPDPYEATTYLVTATGNFTVAAPSNSHIGAPLSFQILNSGAAVTVTWNAAFKRSGTPTTTSGHTNTYDFRWNGTNWIQVGLQTGVV